MKNSYIILTIIFALCAICIAAWAFAIHKKRKTVVFPDIMPEYDGVRYSATLLAVAIPVFYAAI